MPDLITDLDVLVPPDRKVMLGGRVYTLPGDMPLETYLKVNLMAQQQEEGVTEEVLVNHMVDALVDLFVRLMPEGDTRTEAEGTLRKRFLSMGLRTVTTLLNKIYEEEEVDGDPVEADNVDPSPPSGTTPSTASTP